MRLHPGSCQVRDASPPPPPVLVNLVILTFADLTVPASVAATAAPPATSIPAGPSSDLLRALPAASPAGPTMPRSANAAIPIVRTSRGWSVGSHGPGRSEVSTGATALAGPSSAKGSTAGVWSGAGSGSAVGDGSAAVG